MNDLKLLYIPLDVPYKYHNRKVHVFFEDEFLNRWQFQMDLDCI